MDMDDATCRHLSATNSCKGGSAAACLSGFRFSPREWARCQAASDWLNMGFAFPSGSLAGKRRRGDDGAGLRRVAEIMMVLTAAGEVRGGREPTAAERALAAEARERLAAAVSEGAVRPKDLFPGEAVRAVVEDLGLNRAKDPATMGFRFRTPKALAH
ncbi:PHD finger protein [Panicum miliaceum]|uniref:PHD finger protein n=1 Tax=Panicum miliaceum TaxID=4540 RepID=A0A3L6TNN5_PANMI|nr:PHD finger protein [Panicum miliaceum]